MLLVKAWGRFTIFLVRYISGDSDHSLIEGIDDVYEAEGFERCCLELDDSEIDERVETLPAVEYDIVDAEVFDPLLFVDANDNRAVG